jgi:hypothetical protein
MRRIEELTKNHDLLKVQNINFGIRQKKQEIKN